MEKRPVFIENEIYHVYNRGNGVEHVFRNFGNYDYFLKKFHEYMDPYWEVLVYCLMPTHFHFMVRAKPGAAEMVEKRQICVKAYADFCNGYVLAFNKQHGRRGSLFMRNFKRKQVTDDIYARKLICYIHNNPVKDGYVRSAQEWHHSSFDEMCKMTEKECDVNEIVRRFGSKEDFLHAHIAELSPGSIDVKNPRMPYDPTMSKKLYDSMRPDNWEINDDMFGYDQAV